MAEQAFNDVQFIAGSFDFSGHGNSMELTYGAELIEATPFNLGFHNRIPGYESFEGNLQGFLNDATAVDEWLEANLGVRGEPLSVAPNVGTTGNLCYLTNIVNGTYNFGGPVGDPGTFTFEFSSGGPTVRLVRGFSLDKLNLTATVDGSGVDVGAVSATQTLYAALHCTRWGGTTTSVDVLIESDAGDTWAGAETTRFTFAQLTDIGSEWMSLGPGAITDTWYRATFTVAGAAPDVDVFVSLGIK